MSGDGVFCLRVCEASKQTKMVMDVTRVLVFSNKNDNTSSIKNNNKIQSSVLYR
jgi:hypothetical protein